MVKIIVLLFACLGLATVAVSKPRSNEEAPVAPSSPCIDCTADEIQVRPKRQAAGIIDSVGGLVTNILHEAMVHSKRQQAPPPYYRNKYESIGNGEYNTNHVTYNVYNNRYYPYYK